MEQKFSNNSLDLETLREFCKREGEAVTYRKGDQLEREGAFPDYDHYGSFMPSVTAALNDYIMFGAKNLVGYFGEETSPVHIELRGKNLPNDIYNLKDRHGKILG